jgi:hypothetical protein
MSAPQQKEISYNTLMHYLPPFEEKIRAQIRDEMARTPLITTEAMVAELPKKQNAMPPMPGGGGGMDF